MSEWRASRSPSTSLSLQRHLLLRTTNSRDVEPTPISFGLYRFCPTTTSVQEQGDLFESTFGKLNSYHSIAFAKRTQARCDENDDYLVVGGGDHKVGQEPTEGRYEELEEWTRKRFTRAGSVDYKWSGQIFEPVDYVAFIGENQGNQHIYVATGDSGSGLTHGVIAGRLLSDQILGIDNEWSKLYDPKRLGTIAKSLPDMVTHDLQINAQYKRFLQSDIVDVEDLGKGEGGVLNPTFIKPIAVYKDDEGNVHKFSALCPHLKGVVCWNKAEKSWDCPVHGSRFSKEDVQWMGPAKAGLSPADEDAESLQQKAKVAA